MTVIRLSEKRETVARTARVLAEAIPSYGQRIMLRMLNVPSQWRSPPAFDELGPFGAAQYGRPLRIVIDEARASRAPGLELLSAFSERPTLEVCSTDPGATRRIELGPVRPDCDLIETHYVLPEGGRICALGAAGSWRKYPRVAAGEYGLDEAGSLRGLLLAQAARMHQLDAVVCAEPVPSTPTWSNHAREGNVVTPERACVLMGLCLARTTTSPCASREQAARSWVRLVLPWRRRGCASRVLRLATRGLGAAAPAGRARGVHAAAGCRGSTRTNSSTQIPEFMSYGKGLLVLDGKSTEPLGAACDRAGSRAAWGLADGLGQAITVRPLEFQRAALSSVVTGLNEIMATDASGPPVTRTRGAVRSPALVGCAGVRRGTRPSRRCRWRYLGESARATSGMPISESVRVRANFGTHPGHKRP